MGQYIPRCATTGSEIYLLQSIIFKSITFNGKPLKMTNYTHLVKPDLPLDLVADMDTLPILTTASHIRSYDQESLEDSLIVREQSQTKTCQILDDETIRTKSLPEIHKLILNQSKVPQIFVDKLVSLHMGHLSLSVEDLSEYFFHLDRIFNTFAHHSQDFLTLSKNDQAALLIANAPLYYHLYLTRYAIAADGLDQLKVLLGNSLPEDLRDYNNFLTISFRYFASTMRLFKDPMWLDQYEDGTLHLNTKETQNVDSVAACLLFNFRKGIFDEPEKIVKLYVKHLSQQCNNDKTEMERMNQVVVRLNSQIQRYCHGATITMFGAAMRSTTNVSINVLPTPNYQNVSAAEIFVLSFFCGRKLETPKPVQPDYRISFTDVLIVNPKLFLILS